MHVRGTSRADAPPPTATRHSSQSVKRGIGTHGAIDRRFRSAGYPLVRGGRRAHDNRLCAAAKASRRAWSREYRRSGLRPLPAAAGAAVAGARSGGTWESALTCQEFAAVGSVGLSRSARCSARPSTLPGLPAGLAAGSFGGSCRQDACAAGRPGGGAGRGGRATAAFYLRRVRAGLRQTDHGGLGAGRAGARHRDRVAARRSGHRPAGPPMVRQRRGRRLDRAGEPVTKGRQAPAGSRRQAARRRGRGHRRRADAGARARLPGGGRPPRPRCGGHVHRHRHCQVLSRQNTVLAGRQWRSCRSARSTARAGFK